MTIWFSRNLAIVIGILAPLLETIRRRHTWTEDPLSLFDDYILGGMLLYGAWRVSRSIENGRKFLLLGWGFALGLAYAGFDFQLQQLRNGAVDPAPVPAEWVAVVKGLGLLIIIMGLVASLRKMSIEK